MAGGLSRGMGDRPQRRLFAEKYTYIYICSRGRSYLYLWPKNPEKGKEERLRGAPNAQGHALDPHVDPLEEPAALNPGQGSRGAEVLPPL